MKTENKTTDQLVQIIVAHVKIPLPVYDYSHHKKFVVQLPKTKMGKILTSTETVSMSDTFRKSCIRVIEWAVGNDDIGLKEV
jgi:hypothetical protein